MTREPPIYGHPICEKHGQKALRGPYIRKDRAYEYYRWWCQKCQSHKELPPEVAKHRQKLATKWRARRKKTDSYFMEKIREYDLRRYQKNKLDPEYRKKRAAQNRRYYRERLSKDPAWKEAKRVREREYYYRKKLWLMELKRKTGKKILPLTPYRKVKRVVTLIETKHLLGDIGMLAIGKWAHVMPEVYE